MIKEKLAEIAKGLNVVPIVLTAQTLEFKTDSVHVKVSRNKSYPKVWDVSIRNKKGPDRIGKAAGIDQVSILLGKNVNV